MADRVATLKVVDALELDEATRRALKPGELMRDRNGMLRRLPRFFFEVESWEMARATQLTPHFGLWEFVNVDLKETPSQRRYPRYVPCAVSLLASYLELLRDKVRTYIRIAANGAYRTPSHALSTHASPHCWGTAANIHKIGDESLDTQDAIERCGSIAAKLLPSVWVRPFGTDVGTADDHLHVDLGYVTVVPHDAAGEAEPAEAKDE